MEWLLEKNNSGYILYEGKQIKKRKQDKIANPLKLKYEFCITDPILALYLIKKHSKEIKEKIDLQTENLSVAESELANLIIEHENQEK